MRINIHDFFEQKCLRFQSDKQGLNWVKRHLKPTTLLRVGPNYLIDNQEIEKLFNDYIEKQKELYRRRAETAKKNLKLKKKTDEIGPI